MTRNIRSCILIATAFFAMNAPALAQRLDGILLVGSDITKDKAKAWAKSFSPPWIPRSMQLNAIQKCFRVCTARCGAPTRWPQP